jgi:2-hydroxychromene-2-carboxylate isomerase
VFCIVAMVTIINYTIYHSPNAYLGVMLAERAFATLPVRVERKPIFIPRDRGVKVADLLGSDEPPRQSAYHREDCVRWAERYGIEMSFLAPGVFAERAKRWQHSSFGREELPARAYYAAMGTGREQEFDRAVFRAAWVYGQDVNEEAVIRDAARSVGLDADPLLQRAYTEETRRTAEAALAGFDRDAAPGVPTWVVNGQRFWGKDRVDWVVQEVQRLLAAASA